MKTGQDGEIIETLDECRGIGTKVVDQVRQYQRKLSDTHGGLLPGREWRVTEREVELLL